MTSGQAPKTVGGRELEKAGFIEIREIKLAGKGLGLWYEALTPPAKTPDAKDWSPRKGWRREEVLMLRQQKTIWHVFYRFEGTGSGSDSVSALTGGLGDAISTDREMKRYCDLVLSAPERLSREYDGLYAAQGQCYAEQHGED
jgi:hypothetical protein